MSTSEEQGKAPGFTIEGGDLQTYQLAAAIVQRDDGLQNLYKITEGGEPSNVMCSPSEAVIVALLTARVS